MKDFNTILLENNVLTPTQLDNARTGESSTEPLYYRLLREYPELEGAIWKALCDFLEINLINPNQYEADPKLTKVLPAKIAHDYSIVPVTLEGNKLEIAMADPRQFEKCEEFAMLLSRLEGNQEQFKNSLVVTGRLACPTDIATMIKLLYGIGAETVEGMIDDQSPSDISLMYQEVVDLSQEDLAGEDAAIVKFVNQLMLEAVKNEASDIHLEPYEKDLRVRIRIDGMLRTVPVPENLKHLEAAIISRIKIMSNLDIAEKRLPQDGQIRLTVMNRPIDVRVSVLPTMFGQGLALRILDRQVVLRELSNLGMREDQLNLFQQVVTLSHGVVLVTGPTGSGKTTSLYAAINEINREERKIITVEDPIEYQLPGISQIQVRPQINLTFASVLRHILRHDPDVIMVGEIRDQDTAQIAISAAMTGHLVFSTLHTNDAPSAPVRLLEMGVEPYLVSSALEAVMAQRLIRILCQNCRRPVDPAEALPEEQRNEMSYSPIYESAGCPACQNFGYKGRSGIFEMYNINHTIRQLILNRTSADQIRAEAQKMGMTTLHESGMEKVRQGVTSLSEIYRVARAEAIDRYASQI